MKDEQIDLMEFVERGKRAQAEVDAILQQSDKRARQRPRARSTDPQTSHIAAKKAGEKLTWSQRAVLECFEMSEGLTDPELIAKYRVKVHHAENNWPYQSESGLRTRRHELVEAGRLVKLRETEGSGRKFTIWTLKRESV